MKRISILLCSVILTFEFSLGQNQNLLQGFFSKLHNEGEKVKADVHNLSEKIKSDVQKIFRPNAEKRINTDNRENYEEGLIFVTSSTGTPTTAENIYVDRMFFPTDEPVATPVTPEVTPKTPEVTPTTPEVTPKTPEVTPTTPEVTPKTPEVTPKPTAGKAADGEGKENFVGGCLPGYKRTADGRCMEEYK